MKNRTFRKEPRRVTQPLFCPEESKAFLKRFGIKPVGQAKKGPVKKPSEKPKKTQVTVLAEINRQKPKEALEAANLVLKALRTIHPMPFTSRHTLLSYLFFKYNATRAPVYGAVIGRPSYFLRVGIECRPGNKIVAMMDIMETDYDHRKNMVKTFQHHSEAVAEVKSLLEKIKWLKIKSIPEPED